MASGYEIDRGWEKTVELTDGTRVQLALVTPEDAPLIRRGFKKLSKDSKYLRFLTVKEELSDWEVQYLSDVDQVNHVAIGATIPASDSADDTDSTDGSGPNLDREGIGIGRFIRLDTDESHSSQSMGAVAEAAITVVDEYQNLGLGTHLLRWLVRAGRERGVETFRCTLLARNSPVQNLIKMASNSRVIERDGAVLTVEVDIEVDDEMARDAAENVLRLVGRGEAELMEQDDE